MSTIDPDRETILDKFRTVVDHFLGTNPDWQPADVAGRNRHYATMRRGAVQLDLELHMGKGGNGNITYSYTTPHITGSRVLDRSGTLQLKAKVEAIAAKLLAAYVLALPKIDTALQMYRRDVKDCQPESETLRKVWAILGGTKPTYTRYLREFGPGPDISIASEGHNSMEMKLRHLANHQVLAIAKALNTQEPPLVFPHPSETLKVNELGIVYCTDTMVGASVEYPDEQHLYTILWQLDGDEWTAFANVDGEQKYLLSTAGVTFPSDDNFAEAAANLERHLDIRIGGKAAKD